MARSDAGSKLSQLVGGEEASDLRVESVLSVIGRDGRWVDLVGTRRFENRDSVKVWQVDGLIWRGPEACAPLLLCVSFDDQRSMNGSRVLPSRGWNRLQYVLVSVADVKSGGV